MLQTHPSIETSAYKTTSQGELLVDIYRSPKMSVGCAVFLHGGALLLGSRKDVSQKMVASLNAEGWDVAALDYRVSPETSLPDIQ